MKFTHNIKYYLIGIVVLTACSKGAGNKPVTPVTPGDSDTTGKIIPQKDPAIAPTAGFYLDDWAPKTFTTPAYADTTKPSAAATVTINVDYSNVITKVSKYLFGNNTNPYMGQLITAPDLINSIKSLAPNILRFPGGSISDVYFWNGIIPADAPANLEDSNGNSSAAGYWLGNNTAGWTLSLDNYYTALQQTNSTGMITINYAYARYGTSAHPDQTAAHLAANWVRYDKGRTKYWEIGNENPGPWEPGYRIDVTQNQDGQPQTITGTLYGQHFKVFADSMRAAAKEVGAQIAIGAQIVSADVPYFPAYKAWNSGLFAAAGNYPDFYIVHDYFTGGDNENAATILATPATELQSIMSWVNSTEQLGGVQSKPIALTEWNLQAAGSEQMVSNVAGIHAVMVLGEMLKNKLGMASRWDLANGWSGGNDMGMFSEGDEPDNSTKWNPRPAFYHMYYFQKYFGDRMVNSTVTGSSDVFSYASSFTSGQAGVVVVNRGLASQVVNINMQNFAAGTRYYYYVLVGGTDNGEFSRKVYINGNGPSPASGGPSNYPQIKAKAALIQGGIKVTSPPRSVIFIVADGK